MYNRYTAQKIVNDFLLNQSSDLKFKYSDPNELNAFLRDFIIGCILHDKKTSICSLNNKETLIESIHSTTIGKFIATSERLPSFIEAKKSNRNQLSLYKTNHSLAMNAQKELASSVNEIYHSLYSPVFGKKTYHDLLQYLALSNLECMLYIAPAIKLDHTTAEYSILRTALKECIAMKRSIDDFDPFTTTLAKSGIEHNNSLDSLYLKMEQLIDLKERVENIFDMLSRAVHDLSATWRDEYELKYLDTIKEKRKFESSLHFYISNFGETPAVEPGIISFSSDQKTKYLAWKKLKEDFLVFKDTIRAIPWMKMHGTENISVGEIQEFCNKINVQILSFRDNLEKLISDKLDRINFINLPHPTLASNLASLELCIEEFNKLADVNQKIEINTNSCLRHIQLCKKLILAIVSMLKQFSTYPETIRWRQAMEKLNAEHLRLLQELQYFPLDSWEQHLEDYYFQSLKLKFYSPMHQMLTHERESLFLSDSMVAQAENLLCLAYAEALIENSMAEIQRTDSKLYKRIIKNEPLTPGESLSIAGMFPIFIHHVHNETADVFVTIDGSHLYISRTPELAEVQMNTIALNQTLPSINQPLSDCTAMQKLNMARDLAKLLMENAGNIRLFQLRTANVIACVSDNIFHHFLDALDESGVKETQCEDRKLDTVIEALIDTGRPQYLLLQDELLNTNDIMNFQWHNDIIHVMNLAGVKTINISSYALYKEGMYALDSICTRLNGSLEVDRREQNVLQNTI